MVKSFEDYYKTRILYGCTLVDTTNERFSYMKGLIGSISPLQDNNVLFFYTRGLTPFHTSYVVSMVEVNNVLCVTTRNSKYWFKIPVKQYYEDEDNNEGVKSKTSKIYR